MLTAHTIKIIQSLDKKKFRQKYNLFLVEGNKTLSELKDSSYKVREIFSTEPSAEALEDFDHKIITEITPRDLKKISFLQHPKDSLALVEIPSETSPKEPSFELVLDGVQDPGNLGTLIRLCDWFGLEQLICSEDTVDLYNPKVIQASMGSFTRVEVIYTNLSSYLSNTDAAVIGTDMQGENLYEFDFPAKAKLVLGSEGNGMRAETRDALSRVLTIPRFGKTRATESLNVSMAAGIILGEYFSRGYSN